MQTRPEKWMPWTESETEELAAVFDQIRTTTAFRPPSFYNNTVTFLVNIVVEINKDKKSPQMLKY